MKKWIFCSLVLFGCDGAKQPAPPFVKDSSLSVNDTIAVASMPKQAFLLAGDFNLFYTGSNHKHPVSIRIDSVGNITQSKVYGKMVLDGEPPCQAMLYKLADSNSCDTFLVSKNMDFYYTLKLKHGKKSYDLVPKSMQP